jgi:FkbM family methyltransferase
MSSSFLDRIARRLRGDPQGAALRSFYGRFLGKGDLCFDVGANIGNRTEVFRNLGARVIAVEPQSACVRALREAFGKDPDVVIVPQGLADAPGEAELSVCEEAPTISTMSARWREEGRFSTEHQWKRVEKVPLTTLDALIAEHGIPRFCKIDVEGFELSVLRGLSRPLPCISFEFTREFWGDAKACVARLETLGSLELNVSLAETMEFHLPAWVSAEGLDAAIEALPDPRLWGDIYAKAR